MKTPREILLARHQAAEPKLDAVRGRALAALGPTVEALKREKVEADAGSTLQRFNASTLLAACRDFFRIPRVAWAGLAAAWFVILALNAASRDTTTTTTPTQEAKRTPENLQALREQKRLFAELVGFGNPYDADAPRFVPRPRSESQPHIAFA